MSKMLRKMHGCPRKVQDDAQMGEIWVEWIVRATRSVEEVMYSVNVDGWVEEQQRRKEHLARQVRTCTDGRWSTKVL